MYSLCKHIDIKTHGRVSAAKKDARAQVCYLRDRSSSRFQPIITQKTMASISTKFTYFNQDTRSCVSGQERRASTSVLFTRPVK